ncbi:MAG TPA: hypothetical protein VJ385_07945 [Fibrobacteria bacterium]|nr:hypothetical protein [Fibrobacteria bacterium]
MVLNAHPFPPARMSPLPDRPSPRLLPLAWSLFAALILALSVCIPLFSRPDPERVTIAYPPLFPFYYQTNGDAPLEMSTSLGFPGFYREQPFRVARPAFYAVLAGARTLLRPGADLILGKEGAERMWGEWPARDHVITYCLWILANFALLLAAARMAYKMALPYFPAAQASLACALLLASPIVLLALREIHLNALNVFMGIACLAFWKTALSERLSPGGLFLPSLALGVAFQGKLCLNGFGVGLCLCLLSGQGRKLIRILPGLAIPFLGWFLIVKAMGIPFGYPEVTRWRAGVWILEAGFSGAPAEFRWYVGQWLGALGESLGPGHVVFAALGAWSLFRGPVPPGAPHPRRALLRLALLIAAADFGFYFLVHRVHAAYFMNTVFCVLLLACEGLAWAASLAAERLSPPWGRTAKFRLCMVAAAAFQIALLWRQLPRYGG